MQNYKYEEKKVKQPKQTKQTQKQQNQIKNLIISK